MVSFLLYDKRQKREKVSILSKVYLPGDRSRGLYESAGLILQALPGPTVAVTPEQLVRNAIYSGTRSR